MVMLMLNVFFYTYVLLPILVLLLSRQLFFVDSVCFDYFNLIFKDAVIHQTQNTTRLLFAVIGLVSVLFLLYKKKSLYYNYQYFCILTILFAIIVFFNTNNILVLFISYELLLLPSCLLVFFFSPNKRSFLTSVYFFLWTQGGSFLVFCGIVYLVKNNIFFTFSLHEVPNSVFLFFIVFGLAIKIPIWPFHFWLTKTHVEANTLFSIFLSGVLVKTALYFLIKICYWNDSCLWLFTPFVLVGIFDVSFKIIYQTDFKKLIAYTTIQEMGFLSLFVIFQGTLTETLFVQFSVFHLCLSSLLFIFMDFLYLRFGTRQLNLIKNLLNKLPILAFTFYVTLLCFNGLPLTIKFFFELTLLYKYMFSSYKLLAFFFVLVQYLSVVFFFTHCIGFLFSNAVYTKQDLTKQEFLIIFFFLTTVLFVVRC